ncbi:MAG: DUF3791 domain-containing protein [Odoribacteraceae bacterium]|jgi:hypothetical protein|nr:DUF3791 domain-containing protein [Odoribacteraceae bacterium]
MENTIRPGTLNVDVSDRLSFVTFIIPYFADEYKMNRQEAYHYLKKYGGIDFIFKHWWTLHVDNPFWSVRGIHDFCHENGGLR